VVDKSPASGFCQQPKARRCVLSWSTNLLHRRSRMHAVWTIVGPCTYPAGWWARCGKTCLRGRRVDGRHCIVQRDFLGFGRRRDVSLGGKGNDMCRELRGIASSPFWVVLPCRFGNMGTNGINIGCITRSDVDGDGESWRQFDIGREHVVQAVALNETGSKIAMLHAVHRCRSMYSAGWFIRLTSRAQARDRRQPFRLNTKGRNTASKPRRVRASRRSSLSSLCSHPRSSRQARRAL
jgi:hypothetical protein